MATLEGRGGQNRERYSGRDLERDVLGIGPLDVRRGPRVDVLREVERKTKAERDLTKLMARGEDGRRDWISRETAETFVREHHPIDPARPETEFGRLVFEEIGRLMKAKFGVHEMPPGALKIFNAIGTPLDIFYGIDAWIEMKNPRNNAHARVSLDVTQNSQKLAEGYKADVLIPPLNFPLKKEFITDKERDRYNQEVAEYRAVVHAIAARIFAHALPTLDVQLGRRAATSANVPRPSASRPFPRPTS